MGVNIKEVYSLGFRRLTVEEREDEKEWNRQLKELEKDEKLNLSKRKSRWLKLGGKDYRSSSHNWTFADLKSPSSMYT